MRAHAKLCSATLCMLLAASAALLGCTQSGKGQSSSTNSDDAISTEPVRLTVFKGQAISDDEWDQLLVQPLKKKYPHITLEPLSGNLADIITSGVVPDLLTQANSYATDFMAYDLLMDMTPLLVKHKIDLKRYDPVYLDALRVLSAKGELYGLPYSGQFNALYYNKDLFDRFGVSYPKDGMTWDDAIALGEKVTRNDGGTQYVGLSYEHISRLSNSLSPDIVDMKTEKANVNNELWKKVFELANRINAIPGNVTTKNDEFIKERRVAMYGTVNLLTKLPDAVTNGLRVGIAQYPSYKEQPNVYGSVDAHYIMISKQSKHKDQAMQVIDLLMSDEVQRISTRKFARLSPLQDNELKKQLAADIKAFEGINISSIFKSKPAPAPAFSKHYREARKILEAKFVDYNTGQKDVNTTLREIDEAINKLIGNAK
ncbi:extracellular solute-binding protein [Paenibacillus hemerocallicola]|uniref:Extracellular solute-binding protein n=1 Tax=Paenibacillus hemerocallicola TaxID=1172614 RepID=A0A5C4SWJ9_9BACL|nr:extracellular solute-binding protein [Paenibacillus hemerocallicola]TNJ59409.1 extracellular solute-binding protein [Paenibacillus hemerocallicola]